MKRLLSALALMLACATAQPAQAAQQTFVSFVNGNELYGWCMATRNSLCAAYVMGVTDALRHPSYVQSGHMWTCMSANVSASQVVDVVVNYLYSHPQTRNDGAIELVTQAVMGAWPC
jgi:hypothetical protein